MSKRYPVKRERHCQCGKTLRQDWRGKLCSACMDRRARNESIAMRIQREHLESMGIDRSDIDESAHVRGDQP